jgi:ATP-dependent Clp protease ATP-binding subunit ClpA
VLVKDEANASADAEKIGFEYVEGPVTPKPEKLPVARKRKPPKPGGPSGPNGGGGGSKGPVSKGPLVKV